MSNLSDTCSDHNSLQLMELDHGGWSRRGHEFWYARRAFLNSYHLSMETNNNGSFKRKLKKSVKEINEAVIGVVLSIRRGMQKRKVGVKAYRVTMNLPSLVLVTMRCFMPWLYKRKNV
ncbi:hypothetical protein TanjilG_23498 [Lupinus angustifolius]|uniref:Uncharacterized protein n=1 Tax=Lupinus angustifolius TaxID=3871 RepID=A0A4P1R9C6_LUPAN|nr:hypothetical protein TanjilG_23498 [Lupinus angustifolius]